MIKSAIHYLSSDGREHKTLDEVEAHERRAKIAAIMLLRKAQLPKSLDAVPLADLAEAIAATHFETRKAFDLIASEVKAVSGIAPVEPEPSAVDTSVFAKPVTRSVETVPNRFFSAPQSFSDTKIGAAVATPAVDIDLADAELETALNDLRAGKSI